LPQKTNQSIERAIDILFCFSRERPTLTINDISRQTGLPLSTCYRLIGTLRKKGLIDLNEEPNRYHLGMALLRFHDIIMDSLDLVGIARPFLERLTEISGETAQLIRRNNNVGICIEKTDSPATLMVRPDKGTVIGLHSGASGKAILAFLPLKEQERIIAQTGLKKFGPSTITDPAVLREKLDRIRRQGYAVSHEEIYAGVAALAVPVFDAADRVVASICVAGPKERFSDEKIKALVGPLMDAARSISTRLGHTV